MTGSFVYHRAVAAISRMIVLRSKRGSPERCLSTFLESHYKNSTVWVVGSKHSEARFPGLLRKAGGKLMMTKPSVEYWYARDGQGFVRGDICMVSASVSQADVFRSFFESRVLWNASQVVHASVETWTKNVAFASAREYLIQSTNRIAGAEYVIVRGTLSGILSFMDSLAGSGCFGPWTELSEPLAAALEDVNKNWAKKWFVTDRRVYDESVKALV